MGRMGGTISSGTCPSPNKNNETTNVGMHSKNIYGETTDGSDKKKSQIYYLITPDGNEQEMLKGGDSTYLAKDGKSFISIDKKDFLSKPEVKQFQGKNDYDERLKKEFDENERRSKAERRRKFIIQCSIIAGVIIAILMGTGGGIMIRLKRRKG
jgi:hypothetical protein